MEGFFHNLSAVNPRDTNVVLEQGSSPNDRIQPLSAGGRYAPPSMDDGGAQLAHTMSHESGYWHTDDEASMADSDDDVDEDSLFQSQTAHLESNDLGIRVARRANAPVDFYGTQLRTFTGFVDANSILATYTPSSTNSPLNDSQTAAVFWYFVNVTGPSMSLYERHPFNPSPMFQGQPVAKVRQHIWTCK